MMRRAMPWLLVLLWLEACSSVPTSKTVEHRRKENGKETRPERVRIVSPRPSRDTSAPHLDSRGIQRSRPLDRWVYLTAASREVDLLEGQVGGLVRKTSEAERDQKGIDMRKLRDKIKDAREDLRLLRRTNDSAWERYQVRLDNNIHDLSEALRQAYAE